MKAIPYPLESRSWPTFRVTIITITTSHLTLASVHTDLDEVAHPLDLILDGVALHQEGVVSLTVDHTGHPVVITLHEDIFLGLHEGFHPGECWVFRILQRKID